MFAIGKQYGAFFCEIGQNDLHKNIAYLVVIGGGADVTVIDKSGAHYTGSAFLIRPLVEHKLFSSAPAWNIFLAPYSAFALSLDKFASDNGVSILPDNALPFSNEMPNQKILDILNGVMAGSSIKMDVRLASVLEDMDEVGPQSSLAEIAKRYGLSPSRLRVIAKEQLGVPLSELVVWRKSIRSMKALSLGSTLSEAAQVGGFSDQAHFTRTIRKMFGVTPSNTLQAFYYEK